MKIYTIFLISVFFQWKCFADIIGNLAFFGRGQRQLPNYWCETDEIKGTDGSKIFFPYSDNEIIDDARNHPLVLYIPGRKDGEKFSHVSFYLSDQDNEDVEIDFSTFHKIKSEMKLVQPRKNDVIRYLKNNNLDATEICQILSVPDADCSTASDKNLDNIEESFNFENYKTKWLELVDIALYLESEEVNNDYEEEDEEIKEILRYKIEEFGNLSDEWSECTGNIIKKNIMGMNNIYDTFTFRNYGISPVYIYIGNTMFLKRDPTYMVKEGVIQNNFHNWSWHKGNNDPNKITTYFENQVYEGDPEKKNCAKFVSKECGASCYYVHIPNGISAPPEGISFRIRPIQDNQFKIKIDNKKEYNLTSDYLIHRNCKIPIGEESEFLIDVRSLVYSNPRFMLNNDISGFWIQSISRISEITQAMREDPNQGEKIALAYEDVFYFYDFVLHNTYPSDATDKSKYVQEKLFEEGEECNNALETHKDWEDENKRNKENPVIAWPNDIDLDTIEERGYQIDPSDGTKIIYCDSAHECHSINHEANDNGKHYLDAVSRRIITCVTNECHLEDPTLKGYFLNGAMNSADGKSIIKCVGTGLQPCSVVTDSTTFNGVGTVKVNINLEGSTTTVELCVTEDCSTIKEISNLLPQPEYLTLEVKKNKFPGVTSDGTISVMLDNDGSVILLEEASLPPCKVNPSTNFCITKDNKIKDAAGNEITSTNKSDIFYFKNDGSSAEEINTSIGEVMDIMAYECTFDNTLVGCHLIKGYIIDEEISVQCSGWKRVGCVARRIGSLKEECSGEVSEGELTKSKKLCFKTTVIDTSTSTTMTTVMFQASDINAIYGVTKGEFVSLSISNKMVVVGNSNYGIYKDISNGNNYISCSNNNYCNSRPKKSFIYNDCSEAYDTGAFFTGLFVIDDKDKERFCITESLFTNGEGQYIMHYYYFINKYSLITINSLESSIQLDRRSGFICVNNKNKVVKDIEKDEICETEQTKYKCNNGQCEIISPSQCNVKTGLNCDSNTYYLIDKNTEIPINDNGDLYYCISSEEPCSKITKAGYYVVSKELYYTCHDSESGIICSKGKIYEDCNVKTGLNCDRNTYYLIDKNTEIPSNDNGDLYYCTSSEAPCSKITKAGYYVVSKELYYICKNSESGIVCSKGKIYKACNEDNVERIYSDNNSNGNLNICLANGVNVELNNANSGNYIITKNSIDNVFGINGEYTNGIVNIKDNVVTLNNTINFRYVYSNGESNKLIENTDTCPNIDEVKEYKCENGKCNFIY